MRKKSFLAVAAALVLIWGAMPVQGAALFANSDSNVLWGSSGTTSAAQAPSKTYPHASIKQAIANHKAVNKDVLGWLIIPNTNISMPIPFSNQDNNYYVYRDWRGTHYPNITYQNYVDTATYLDYRTVFGEGWKQSTSRNMVLYGHNWNNLRTPFAVGNKPGYTMFAQLPSYTNIDFAKANPHVYFSTENLEGVWRVFAVGYCETSLNFFYNSPNPTDERYAKILSEWKARSLFNFGVDVDISDRIITLSTCTRQYAAGDLQRYCVVARLLRPGESESDPVSIAVNPNVKNPQFGA